MRPEKPDGQEGETTEGDGAGVASDTGGDVVETVGAKVGSKVGADVGTGVTSDVGGEVDETVGADVGSTVGADVGAGGFGGPHVTLYAQLQFWVELSNRVPAGHEMG